MERSAGELLAVEAAIGVEVAVLVEFDSVFEQPLRITVRPMVADKAWKVKVRRLEEFRAEPRPNKNSVVFTKHFPLKVSAQAL